MSAQSFVLKYPLDLTGRHANNRVTGEPHSLTLGDRRLLIPQYGAFYSNSVSVRTRGSGQTLDPRVDYYAIQLHPEATERSGLEVCLAIVVVNPSIDSEVLIDYQAVGGDYLFSVDALSSLVETLSLDERPVQWGMLLDKPTAFVPAAHYHDAGDLYGFETVVEALDRLRDVFLVAAGYRLDEGGYAFEQIQGQFRRLEQRIEELALFQHQTDRGQAHGLSVGQLGLGQLVNHPLLTVMQVSQSSLFSLTGEGNQTQEGDSSLSTLLMLQHQMDQGKAHRLSTDQLGLGQLTQYPLLTTLKVSQVNHQQLMGYFQC